MSWGTLSKEAFVTEAFNIGDFDPVPMNEILSRGVILYPDSESAFSLKFPISNNLKGSVIFIKLFTKPSTIVPQ